MTLMMNNTGPAFEEGNNWFTVLGVYFPTVTGVMAGINMSGDLKNPSRDIPNGTLAAVGLSCFLYMSFIIVLGSTCLREMLYTNNLIAAKVSALGKLHYQLEHIWEPTNSFSTCRGDALGRPVHFLVIKQSGNILWNSPSPPIHCKPESYSCHPIHEQRSKLPVPIFPTLLANLFNV